MNNPEITAVVKDSLSLSCTGFITTQEGVVDAQQAKLSDEEVAMAVLYANVTSIVALEYRCFDVDVFISGGKLALDEPFDAESVITPGIAEIMCLEAWSELLLECKFNLNRPLAQIKEYAGLLKPRTPINEIEIAKELLARKVERIFQITINVEHKPAPIKAIEGKNTP